MALPTLVLVHGSFHREEVWDVLIEELPDVDIRTIQLPSSAPVPVDQLGSMYEDARAVKDLVLDVKGPVVVCAHSYGGVPVSEGLAGVGAVKHIVYLNSFVLDVGESMLGNRGGSYPPHWGVHENERYIEMIGAEEVFYNDLSPRDAERAARTLGPQSLVSMRQPLTQAAWRDTASTYVIRLPTCSILASSRSRRRPVRVRRVTLPQNSSRGGTSDPFLLPASWCLRRGPCKRTSRTSRRPV
ncbi:hypothetical protein Sm713_40190 [Streptomyces sp. TS71-3]|nr:hypothetical protein Sm713_40190 [Streptomyces sp. TS71-3]